MNVSPARLATFTEEEKILWAQAELGKLLVTDEESKLLESLARTMKLGTAQSPVSPADSFVSMVQSIQARGFEQKDLLLQLARRPKEEREAELELFAFVREVLPPIRNAVVWQARNEGEAKRDFRDRLKEKLRGMYPGADEATIALTIGQCFEDVPGGWGFSVSRCVLALRNQKRFG